MNACGIPVPGAVIPETCHNVTSVLPITSVSL